MFTDAVAFSAVASVNEDGAYSMLNEDFVAMRAIAAEFGGRTLKSTGDGLLIVFDSAAQAVDCGVKIQTRFAGRRRGLLRHRVGIHLSDVILEEADAQGEGVNIAARLEPLASPGTVVISQTVYDVVKPLGTVRVRPLGEQRLKHIPEPMRVYEIVPAGCNAAPRKSSNSGSPSAGISLVAASLLVLLGGIYAWRMLRPDARALPSSPAFHRSPGRTAPDGPAVGVEVQSLPRTPGYDVPHVGATDTQDPAPEEKLAPNQVPESEAQTQRVERQVENPRSSGVGPPP